MSFPKWRSAVATALAALLMSALTPPAIAAPSLQVPNCHRLKLPSGGDTWYCEPILVERSFPPDDDCEECGFALDWLIDPRISPQVHNTVHQGIADGLRLLGRAAYATTPSDRSRLENEALLSFARVVAATSGYRLGVASVGAVDVSTAWYRPRPDLPWLAAAAEDVVEGVRLAQRSGPSPQPWAAAMVKFKEAYQELSRQTAIG